MLITPKFPYLRRQISWYGAYFCKFISKSFDITYCLYATIHSSIHSFIHQWLHSPLFCSGLFFSFVIFSHKDGRIPWTGDQPVARPLPTHRTTEPQNKRTNRHPCLEWDSNPRSQRSSERKQFMPQSAHPL
jgi:hypothetical protein